MKNLYITDKLYRYVKSNNDIHKKARINPKYKKATHNIEDKYIINPLRQSVIEPPICNENESAILIDRLWVKTLDRIGQYYYKPDGTKIIITELNVDIPDGCIVTDPLTSYHDTHNGTNWILNISRKEIDELETNSFKEIELEKQQSGINKKSKKQLFKMIDNLVNENDEMQIQINGLKDINKKIIMFIRNL